jgi:RNA recognition motif-containing protein
MFVGSIYTLCMHVQDLVAFFAHCGAVAGIRVVRDKVTGRPKGTALVQFTTEQAVPVALLKHEQLLCGATVKVTRSRFPALVDGSSGSSGGGTGGGAGDRRSQ